MAKYDEHGRHIPDPTPIAVPLRYKRMTDDQRLAAAVSEILSRKAAADGYETVDESLDFEIDDGFEPSDIDTPYTGYAEMIPEYFDEKRYVEAKKYLEKFVQDDINSQNVKKNKTERDERENNSSYQNGASSPNSPTD